MTRAELSRRAFCAGLGAAGAMLVASRAGAATAGVKAPVPDIIGEMRRVVTRQQDTLIDLARTHKLGYVEMVAANPGIDPWVPGEGTQVLLPTAHVLPVGPREGVLVNLADMRFYYFPGGGRPAESYPIGTSRDTWTTPTGSTTIVRKQKNPTWFPTPSIRKDDPTLPARVPAGPDNPLGKYALYLGWPTYLIHGTNKPEGVGRRVSRGCVRMYPEDVEHLFSRISIGTKVTVVNQQMKLGWRAGELFIEVHTNRDQSDELEETGKFKTAMVPNLRQQVLAAAGKQAAEIDWEIVDRAVAQRHGFPVQILKTDRAASNPA